MYRYDPYTDTTRLMTDGEKEEMQLEIERSKEARANWLEKREKTENKRKRRLVQISREELMAKRKNTPLARKLAGLYEEMVGSPFPGGVENAYVCRTYAGYWQQASGAMSWSLECINNVGDDDGHTLAPCSFGSQHPATNCIKDTSLLEFGW